MSDRVSPDELRVSHADRDRTADALRAAAGDGRLTAEELDDRLEKALTARNVGELVVLTRDLAAVPGPTAGPTAGPPGRAPKDVIRIERQGGNARKNGRWLVPRLIEVRVESGHVVLDFTEAAITLPVLHIDAEVRSGTLTLLTRPGIEVDADDVAVRTSGTVKIRKSRGPTVPVVLRVEISGTVEASHLRARRRRRLFRRGGR
jgi:Domain of unknown function (DUF1707)